MLIINFKHVSNAVGGGKVDRRTVGQMDGLMAGNDSAVSASKKANAAIINA